MSHTLIVTRYEGTDPGEEYSPTVDFECTNAPEASCRNYPSGAEEWSEGDPESVPQPECWVQGWFDADCWHLDSEPYETAEDSVPNVTDRFEVEVEFTGDEVAFSRISADSSPKEQS